jgi:hypothetical protein
MDLIHFGVFCENDFLKQEKVIGDGDGGFLKVGRHGNGDWGRCSSFWR